MAKNQRMNRAFPVRAFLRDSSKCEPKSLRPDLRRFNNILEKLSFSKERENGLPSSNKITHSIINFVPVKTPNFYESFFNFYKKKFDVASAIFLSFSAAISRMCSMLLKR